MKIRLIILTLLLPAMVNAAPPKEFINSCTDMMARAERGISIDRYSDLLFDLGKTSRAVLDDEANKENRDYEYLKRHVEAIMQYAEGIAALKKHLELEHFRYVPVDYRRSAYGIDCPQYQVLAGVEVCQINTLIDTATAQIKKELDIVVKGLRDGF